MEDSGPYAGTADADFLAAYEAAQQEKASETGIHPLGSGSDYTPFLQRLGVSYLGDCMRFYRLILCLLRAAGGKHGSGLWRYTLGRTVPLPLGLRLREMAGTLW